VLPVGPSVVRGGPSRRPHYQQVLGPQCGGRERPPLDARQTVFDKLQANYQRFCALEAALLDPAVAGDVGG